MNLAFSVPLACPPSVTQYLSKPAIATFRAAFLRLMAQELVRAYRCRTYVAWWGGEFERAESVYLIAPGKITLVSSVKGALESRMLDVLKSWAKTVPLVLSERNSTVYRLVYDVYGEDIKDPERWVTDLVAKDAVARGWAPSLVVGKKRLKVEAVHPERLLSEKDAVEELSRQLHERHPSFSRELNRQIAKTIRSREWQPDYSDYAP